jgi:hypothetical protein
MALIPSRTIQRAEDQAHDGHEVFIRRQIGVRPQIVSDLPEIVLKFFDALKVVGNHYLVLRPLPLSRGLPAWPALPSSSTSTISFSSSANCPGHLLRNLSVRPR